MSNTFKSQVSKGSHLKIEGEYKGYLGESCWSSKGRKWFSKRIHKINRLRGKKLVERELTLSQE